MNDFALRIGLAVGLAAMAGGCAGESAPPSSSVTTGPSPVLTAPPDSGDTHVTMSGYLETGVTAQVK